MGDITKEMAEAGADVLCAKVDALSTPGRWSMAVELAREVYQAMAAKAPKQAAGKAEPAPTFESAPGNVVQLNPKK